MHPSGPKISGKQNPILGISKELIILEPGLLAQLAMQCDGGYALVIEEILQLMQTADRITEYHGLAFPSPSHLF